MPLLTPFIRPRTISRFVFTYVIPLVPLFSLWDGFASCFRVYSPSELKRMTDTIGAKDYVWETGRMKFERGPGYATYLLGRPVSLPR
jgi:hypothetical protein